MGEHKSKRFRGVPGRGWMDVSTVPLATSADLMLTDLDEVGRILAGEVIYCELCGLSMPLWPPEVLVEHSITEHRSTVWPAFAASWDEYKNDRDAARRENFIAAHRVNYFFQTMTRRADLYAKLLSAGVLRVPAHG
jgi:hypothetical protein